MPRNSLNPRPRPRRRAGSAAPTAAGPHHPADSRPHRPAFSGSARHKKKKTSRPPARPPSIWLSRPVAQPLHSTAPHSGSRTPVVGGRSSLLLVGGASVTRAELCCRGGGLRPPRDFSERDFFQVRENRARRLLRGGEGGGSAWCVRHQIDVTLRPPPSSGPSRPPGPTSEARCSPKK